MSEQLSLYDALMDHSGQRAHRLRGHDTERRAARVNRGGRVTQRLRVARVLETWADGTDYEISERLGIARHVVAKRRGELVEVGLVEPTETTRPTDTGSPARVWRLTAEGKRWTQERVGWS